MAAPRNRGLALIGGFKLVKATGLVVVGLGVLSLVHRDVARTINALVEQLRIDPENSVIHGLVAKLVGVRPSRLEEVGFGTLFYAALFATEGVGLILAKRWAEYMTLVVTVSFLPLEVYELVAHRSVLKATVVVVNVAVALYLLRVLRRQRLP